MAFFERKSEKKKEKIYSQSIQSTTPESTNLSVLLFLKRLFFSQTTTFIEEKEYKKLSRNTRTKCGADQQLLH
jgi:hypothetical protein